MGTEKPLTFSGGGFIHQWQHLFVVPVIVALVVIINTARGTALDDYVWADDPCYGYVQVGSSVFDSNTFTTAYTLRLTSQTWRDSSEVDHTVWEHWVTIYTRLSVLIDWDTALLLIDDGNNTDPAPEYDAAFRGLCAGTYSVIAVVSAIPNQPLQFSDEGLPRTEDEIIAYSWEKFLHGEDANWPAQLPMVKATVRAMDTIQDFLGNLGLFSRITINKFVLTGGSKRGWTAWLTAAVDNRVIAIAPIVSDLLNMDRSFAHHWAAYGFWADALSPYEELGIFEWFDTSQGTELLKIVDPYEYRDRLNLPKYIVNAAGDDFFVCDSIQFYIDELLGETYLRHVPNTDHYLTDAFDSVFNAMVPYYNAFLNSQARPAFSWTLQENGAIRVETVDEPNAVKLWQINNEHSRDFRQVVTGPNWVSTELSEKSPGVYIGEVNEPNFGWTAFFLELTYDNQFDQDYAEVPGQYFYHFTSEIHVLPEVRPFEADFNRDRETGLVDLMVLGNNWLTDNPYRDIVPRRYGDGIINFNDYSVFALHWLQIH